MDDKKRSEVIYCSYCKCRVGRKYSFNSIFIAPTVYKCTRWWCTLLKYFGLLKKTPIYPDKRRLTRELIDEDISKI